MKVSLQWLNTYLDTPISADDAAELLTAGGFPVEERDELDGGDVRLDVEVTSNRSDVLSHLGVAREIAARSDRTLKRPEIVLPTGEGDVNALMSVTNESGDLCPLYTARVITGVKVGPSPDWLRTAIENAGGRSVNNVVDVTNYVLLETGQPLHVFDLGKLAGQKIVVRRAAAGERFVAIDHSEHKLRDDMLVIADEQRPVALAGVMGGADSEVGDTTADLLIESAIFEPLTVRRASRRLKLASDSSFRFERGVDPRGVDWASRRCCELVLKVAGGSLKEGVIRVGQDDPSLHTITLRVQRTVDLLGIELSAEEQAAYLGSLGIETTLAGDTLTATIPSFRLDLVREVDLIEEIARQHDLDKIPLNEKISIVAHHPQPSVLAKRRLIEVLVAHGYHETVTPSLLARKHAEPFVLAGAEPALLYEDMRRQDNTLRPAVLPSLLACRKLNQDCGNAGVKLFELASGWSKRDGKIKENWQLAVIRDAEDAQQAVSELKGTIAELVHTLGGESASAGLAFEPIDDPWYAVAAVIKLDGEMAGSVGLLKAALTDHFSLQSPVASALICMERFTALYPPTHNAGELPKYPAIERDLSVVVDEATPWQAVDAAVAQAGPELLESVAFVGTYRGKQVGKGKKSVTLRLMFRDPQRTLRHEQVDPQVATVVTALGEAVKAELRG